MLSEISSWEHRTFYANKKKTKLKYNIGDKLDAFDYFNEHKICEVTNMTPYIITLSYKEKNRRLG